MAATASESNNKSTTKLPAFAIFLLTTIVYGGIASRLNHVDDTDETYGYWEVLHYLLYGHGMQTWEYAPAYAIRTYSFVAPMYLIGEFLKYLQLPKIAVFYGLRMMLGLATALAQSHFLSAIQSCYPRNPLYMRFTLLLLLLAPGVFFSSTAFLPSAVASSCIMLSLARWMQLRFLACIFWGCIAVLWTGWPFVGVMVLPLGLHMLASTYSQKGFNGLFRLVVSGGVILALVGGFAGITDVLMYRKWTSPTINILLYNAAGNGDTLYGVEPVSYYVRNLALNLGAAWPLAIAAPVLLLRRLVAGNRAPQRPEKEGEDLEEGDWIARLVPMASACLWLAVLFSRPHKEERFLYPAYPLLAFVAAQSLVSLIDLVGGIAAGLAGEQDVALVTLLYGGGGQHSKNNKEKQPKQPRLKIGGMVKHACLAVSVTIVVTLASSRLLSSANNYGGYMQLWTDLGERIAMENSMTYPRREKVTVCTGGEWYFFPSHFFLPDNTRLEFVSDYFHGQLPQHFRQSIANNGAKGWPWEGDAWIGTWSEPAQPFNDLNREEKSRYVPLSACDYLVALIDPEADQQVHGPMVQAMTLSTAQSFGSRERNSFSFVLDKAVLDPARSKSSLARAFHIPIISSQRNVFNKYTVWSNTPSGV